MKHIAISLLDYKGQEKTLNCLRSIDKLNLKDISLTVIVVDNYKEGTFSFGKEKYKKFTPILIKNKESLGFAGGQNVGIHEALKRGAEYIVILNNDTYLDENLLQELMIAQEADKTRGAIVPKIYFQPGQEFHKAKYKDKDLGKVIWYAGGHIDWANVYGIHEGVDEVDKGQYETSKKVDLLTGCCVMIAAEVFRKVGVFDEKYFLYFEDADLNMRIKRAGYSIYFHPKALLWHYNAASTGGSGSSQQDYFFSRNRMLFGMRYASRRTQIALFREAITLLKTGREWQKKGIKDFFLRKFGSGSYEV